MSNNRAAFSCSLVVFLVLFASAVRAETGTPQPAAETVLTVPDVMIDKTDKNAVSAREQAIADAQRLAFQKLVEKSMTPEAFKAYQMPDDKTIAMLVQDFEIKNEQISANRYAANFTVRFSQEAANYIKSAGGTVDSRYFQPVAYPAGATDKAPAPAVGSTSILVLPYYKNSAGRNVLWEDPNPWREAWQQFEDSVSHSDLSLSVPAGDIADIAFGSSDAVWMGDNSIIDKLQGNYQASFVVLPVAYKSGASIQVDLYVYRGGKLDHVKSLAPYDTGTVGASGDVTVFQKVIPQAIEAIRSLPKNNPPHVEAGLEAIESSLKVVSADGSQQQAAPVIEKITLKATMTFGSFGQWIETQKRLSSMSPPVKLDISSLSKDTAWFTITAEAAGGMESLKTALTGKGLTIYPVVSDANSSGDTLYTIKLN